MSLGTFTAVNLLPLWAGIDDQQPPTMAIPDRTIEWGSLSRGQTAEVSIPIENKGSHRLVINRTERDCNCGDSPKTATIIPPQSAGQLTVVLDKSREAGEFTQVTHFTSNDPREPHFDVIVKYSVSPNL